MHATIEAPRARDSGIRQWTSCPVCDEAHSLPYVRFDEVAFVRCPRCAVVYKSFESATIRPADFYEERYFHGRRSARDRRFEHRVAKARRELHAALEFRDARSLLDIGCSFGYVLEAGRRLGLESAGVDISSYAVKVCRQRGYRAEVGSLERLPFPSGAFDVVTMKHVLEHTPTPKAALAEVSRVLAPNGVILVAVPDLSYWKGTYRRATYRYFRPDDLGQQHYVYFTTQSLHRLLASCGFVVRATTPAFFRRRFARRALTAGLAETARFGGSYLTQAIAGTFRLRRELFFIAQRR